MQHRESHLPLAIRITHLTCIVSLSVWWLLSYKLSPLKIRRIQGHRDRSKTSETELIGLVVGMRVTPVVASLSLEPCILAMRDTTPYTHCWLKAYTTFWKTASQPWRGLSFHYLHYEVLHSAQASCFWVTWDMNSWLQHSFTVKRLLAKSRVVWDRESGNKPCKTTVNGTNRQQRGHGQGRQSISCSKHNP